jgi:AcrR family transcriptional regulator
MNEKFFDLKTEKQERMINASLKIFALNGYQYASTDDIVKEASISKGLLFHYFGSKLGLYTFLADYSVRYMKMETANAADTKETDYFAILKNLETAKLAVMKKFPYMQQFLSSLEQEGYGEAAEAVKTHRASLHTLYQDSLKKADYTRFRPEAEAERIGKLTTMMLRDLLLGNMRSGAFKPEQYHSEAVAYLDMLRRLVNK